MKPVHALILVGAALGVYYASTLDTEPNDNAEGGLFDWLPEIIRAPLQDGFGFIKTSVENVYGETFGYWEMKPTKSILDWIMKHEDIRLVAYESKPGNKDWTIGLGHKLMGSELQTLKSITYDQALQLFDGDINRKAGAPSFREGAASFVRRKLSMDASQDQFDAFVCMAFNTPVGAQGAIGLHNQGKYTEAANFIESYEHPSRPFSKYGGLKTRRKFESDLYRRGITY